MCQGVALKDPGPCSIMSLTLNGNTIKAKTVLLIAQMQPHDKPGSNSF